MTRTAVATDDGSGHPAVTAAAEGGIHLARFEPVDGLDLVAFMRALPEGYYGARAAHLQQLAGRISGEFPVEAAFSDAMAELAAMEATVRDAATEAVHVFHRLHEREIRNVLHPRPGERLWNV